MSDTPYSSLHKKIYARSPELDCGTSPLDSFEPSEAEMVYAHSIETSPLNKTNV